MSEQNNEQAPVQENKVEQAPKGRTKKKRKKLKMFLFFISIAFIFWWFNNYTLATKNYVIFSDKINTDFRIAVLSDLHASKYGISNDKILNTIEKSNPDIVFILGDMYSRRSDDSLIQIPINLTKMIVQSGYTVYFIPGDHDTSREYINAISESGAHVMDYKNEITEVKGNTIEIFGIDNVYFSSSFNLKNAFDRDDSLFSILMAHIPNYQCYSDFGADLTLCGDTHGGIIQLPFSLGPAYYAETDEWFPEISGKRSDIFDKGIFPYNGGSMFITSGIGSYPIAARINNRPEIAVIDIKANQK